MPERYGFEAPVTLEHVDPTDSASFTFRRRLKLDSPAVVTVEGIPCSLSNAHDDRLSLSVPAPTTPFQNADEAFSFFADKVDVAIMALSISLHDELNDPHRGSARLAWLPGASNVLPVPDGAGTPGVSASVAVTLDLKPTFSDAQALVLGLENHPELRFLLDAAYGGLRPGDLRAKFYRAFAVIEYIERKSVKQISTRPLTSTSFVDDLLDRVEEECTKAGHDGNLKVRVRGQVASAIKGRTFENREEKLAAILVDVFGLDTVSRPDGQDEPVTPAFCARFTKARNKLFHGNDPGQLAELVPILQTICVEVVKKLLRS